MRWKFERGVHVIGVDGSKFVNLDGVIDDEFGGLQRVDLFRVAAKDAHGIAHRRKIYDSGHAGEVLHQDARGHVGDLAGGLSLGVPLRQEADVVGGDGSSVLVTEQVLQQDAQGKRKPGKIVILESGERKVGHDAAAGYQGSIWRRSCSDAWSCP